MAAQDFDELRPGMRLGPYELVVPIGLGGMARVWCARELSTGRLVALKMLLPQLAENPAFIEMFVDEARIASRVRHPNVCATWGLGEYGGILCLAMEWVDGPSLMRLLSPGAEDDDELPRIAIRPRVAARMLAEACAGLHAAHELVDENGRALAVVHRDVSPHNILVTSAGCIKVTDFGVAKALGKSNVTMAGQIKGKLAYMSPEQLMGGEIDRRSDVFSLGCVLYEITVGERPFLGEHDPQVMTSIMLGRYQPPTALDAKYPPKLQTIVVRALASEPAERYESAEQLRLALEDYLRQSGPPVSREVIADLLRERCATALAQPAATLAAGVSLTDAPPFGGSHPTGGGEIGVHRPGAAEARSDRSPLVFGLAAVLMGAALGIGVLSYVRANRKSRPNTSSLGSAVTAQPRMTTAKAAALTVAAPMTAGHLGGEVRIHIHPSTAVLVMEGIVLPPGTQFVGRPVDGRTVSILIRAEKHDDTIVLVDSATPDELDIVLMPVGDSTAGGRAGRYGGVRGRPAVPVGSAVGDGGSATGAPPKP